MDQCVVWTEGMNSDAPHPVLRPLRAAQASSVRAKEGTPRAPQVPPTDGSSSARNEGRRQSETVCGHKASVSGQTRRTMGGNGTRQSPGLRDQTASHRVPAAPKQSVPGQVALRPPKQRTPCSALPAMTKLAGAVALMGASGDQTNNKGGARSPSVKMSTGLMDSLPPSEHYRTCWLTTSPS